MLLILAKFGHDSSTEFFVYEPITWKDLRNKYAMEKLRLLFMQV
jgi:hypothetical protein